MDDTPTSTAPTSGRRFAWKTLLLGLIVGMLAGAVGLSAVLLGSYAFIQKRAVAKIAEVKELKPLLLKADLDWTVQDIQGGEVNLSFLAGKPLFLHFWNPSCVSCVAEIPGLNELYETYSAKGIAFAAVAYYGEGDLATDVAANDIRFPVYSGDPSATPSVFQTAAMPTTYIIDREGFVVLHHAGAVDWTQGDGAAFLDRLIEEHTGH